MNNEQYQRIIDEAYENYLKHIDKSNTLLDDAIVVHSTKKGKIKNKETLKEFKSSQGEFINKCKTDQEFSERWGLKIEEKEMSLEERRKLANYNSVFISPITVESWDRNGIPTKLITITYNNETIESYE